MRFDRRRRAGRLAVGLRRCARVVKLVVKRAGTMPPLPSPDLMSQPPLLPPPSPAVATSAVLHWEPLRPDRAAPPQTSHSPSDMAIAAARDSPSKSQPCTSP